MSTRPYDPTGRGSGGLATEMQRIMRSGRFGEMLLDDSIPARKVAGRLVTAMPGVADSKPGDEVLYAHSAGLWRFVYEPSVDATYPWCFVGGPPMRSYVVTGEFTNSASYTATGFTAQELTVPFAGSYDIECGHLAGNNTADFSCMSYAVGATAATDDWAAIHQSSGVNHLTTVSCEYRHAGVAASAVIAARWRGASGGNALSYRRWLHVKPVRVRA